MASGIVTRQWQRSTTTRSKWASPKLRPISAYRSSELALAASRNKIWQIRAASFQAGDDKTGHITTGPNQGIFFFDSKDKRGQVRAALTQNRYIPLEAAMGLSIPFVNLEQSIPGALKRVNQPQVAAADPHAIISQALPSTLPMTISEVIPRFKEGGAFVKFSHDESVSQRELEASLRRYLKENQVKPWFNPFRRIRAGLVKGRPWIEDLFRTPSSRLKVEFLPSSSDPALDPTHETLFSLLRRYGKIADIASQPSDSKIVPRYATIDFARVRSAIMAKNCLHGFKILPDAGGGPSGTLLEMSFEAKRKTHWIREWLFSHPRIVIPILAALLAGVTVMIFDPIRTFFIKTHITQAFHLEGNVVTKWIRSQLNRANDILRFGRRKSDDDTLGVLFEDRQGSIDQIRTWLIETADTFIVIQGPRGSGKKELVIDQALEHRKHKLVIDCKPIQEARGDSATINAAASQVGYRPIFSWMNSMSSLIDLAAQGTIGTKTSFSETLDTQLAKIWGNTAAGLKQIALSGRKKTDKDIDLAEDEYLEAHPERRPVVVIDNFLHKVNESGVVYEKLAEWAAALTTANIAHVIFLTSDISFQKSLNKALPDRVFRQIVLTDCSPETAKRFVIKHLEAEIEDTAGQNAFASEKVQSNISELDETIGVLGGRLTDLEFLSRRMKSGESPKKAVQEIIEQSAAEVLKMFLLDAEVSPGASSTRKWTPQQAWLLISSLAASPDDDLRYHEVLLSDVYKESGETVLQALENAELIAVGSAHGRPRSIRPGKPVYSAAFKKLTDDPVLRSRMDLALLTQLIGIENATVAKVENELKLLQETNARGSLASRVEWLLSKAAKSQEKIQEYEAKSEIMKKVLKVDY